MPRRKQPMALGPGFHLRERRGLDNMFSRPFSHQSFMDLHQGHIGQNYHLDTRMQGAMEKTDTEVNFGIRVWLSKRKLCASCRPVPNACKTVQGMESLLPLLIEQEVARHMLATIMSLFPQWAKINYKQ